LGWAPLVRSRLRGWERSAGRKVQEEGPIEAFALSQQCFMDEIAERPPEAAGKKEEGGKVLTHLFLNTFQG